MAQPLAMLTRYKVIFKWIAECQKLFNKLKQYSTLAPVLWYLTFDQPFVLETDASIKQIDAILSQAQDKGQ